MPFRAKEKQGGVWDSKRRVGNSTVGERATIGKLFLLGHPETMGHRGKKALLDVLLCHVFINSRVLRCTCESSLPDAGFSSSFF